MIELPNILKEDIANDTRQMFLDMLFDQRVQSFPKPYGENNSGMPSKGEEYSCRYQRSRAVEAHWRFKKVLQELKAILSQYFDGGTITAMAYKMLPGDYFRVHDDITNGVGFIYYLSKEWKWDWGGILTVLDPKPESVLPKYNHLVMFERMGIPHYITQVTDYAKEPRMAIVGFINGTPRTRD